MRFQDKVVFVTGAGSGIGEATAILFAKEGANIVIVEKNIETGQKTADKCKEFGREVLVVNIDVSNDKEAQKAVEKTIEEFGKLDILVNNAGFVRQGNLLTGDLMATYDEVINTNLRAVVNLTSLATPYLVQNKGCIVNIASGSTSSMKFGIAFPAYTIAKAGVEMFTRLAALELAESGVRVNAVKPGPVYTNALTNAGIDKTFDEFKDLTAAKKVTKPEEIAELIAFLASDTAKSVTGSVYGMDHGMSLI